MFKHVFITHYFHAIFNLTHTDGQNRLFLSVHYSKPHGTIMLVFLSCLFW
jgi:hypothetical protein